MHWLGRGTVLCRDVATLVDMLFIGWTEDEAYACRLAVIVPNDSEVTDYAPISHSLEYVTFSRRFYSVYLLTNLEYWWKKIPCE